MTSMADRGDVRYVHGAIGNEELHRLDLGLLALARFQRVAEQDFGPSSLELRFAHEIPGGYRTTFEVQPLK